MRVLTGLDLPWGSPGGSVELLKDLYLGPDRLISADVFMLAPTDGPHPSDAPLPALLGVTGKAVSGAGFWDYAERLADEVTRRFPDDGYDVVHCQHLAFGATSALLRAYPEKPHIALVHGTDLLFAERFPTQAEVLRQASRAARVVVVPTTAMADRLRALTTEPRQVTHIPWGVPDHLLTRPPRRTAGECGELRVLYAGRLSQEKGAAELAALLAGVDGIRFSMAAPRQEHAALTAVQDLSAVRYLGWLRRPELWRAFADHDVLVIPSAKLEAFGLVAVEAQACGLPVVYQPVPGLSEALGDSGLALDLLGNPRDAVSVLRGLRGDGDALAELRRAGYRNAARYPLSATAGALEALGASLA